MRRSEEDSFVQALKQEWKLFWDSLKKSPEALQAPSSFESGQLRKLSIEDIKKITRSLSTHRRRLNQELEFLRSEIDNRTHSLESLAEEQRQKALSELNDLNDRGQTMSLRLNQLDQHLRETRTLEDEIAQKSAQ